MYTMLLFILAQTSAAFGDAAEAEISVLDIGTGNGVLPLELSVMGFSKITGKASNLLPISFEIFERLVAAQA